MPPASARGIALALAGALAVGCADEPDDPTPEVDPEVESMAGSAREEILTEYENLGYEIADLEAYLESGAPRPVQIEGFDPHAQLASAQRARATVEDALAAGDAAAAVDSLEVAADRVNDIKRYLGLAEEWGEDVPEDAPADSPTG